MATCTPRPTPSTGARHVTDKERKRSRDRKAQQEHRKRAKNYVTSLEAEIEALKSPPRLGQYELLWLEKKKLHQQVQEYESLISTITSLISKQSGASISDRLQTYVPGHATTDPIYETMISGHPSTLSCNSSACSPEFVMSVEESSICESRPGEMEAVSIENVCCTAIQLNGTAYGIDHAQTPGKMFTDGPSRPCPSRTSGDMTMETGSTDSGYGCCHLKADRLQCTSERRCTDISENNPFPLPAVGHGKPAYSSDIPACEALTTNISKSRSESSASANAHINWIIERAKASEASSSVHSKGQILLDLIFDNIPGSLVSDIKHMLMPVQRCTSTSAYLGICWILYIVLRWQLAPSSASLELLPVCLRPTTAQALVPHSVMIDFLIWPAWRDALIVHEQSAPDEIPHIMASFGNCIHFNYQPHTDAASSVEDIFCKAVGDPSNWTVGEEFFDIYPHWRSLYQQCKRSSQTYCT